VVYIGTFGGERRGVLPMNFGWTKRTCEMLGCFLGNEQGCDGVFSVWCKFGTYF
jgi:hypothetical protein